MKRKPKTAYLWVALHGESCAIWKKHGQWVCVEASEHLKWMVRMNATDALRELNRRRLHHCWQSRGAIFPARSAQVARRFQPGMYEGKSPEEVRKVIGTGLSLAPSGTSSSGMSFYHRGHTGLRGCLK